MSDVEIGLVCYSQVQQSAVSGLTDLLKVGGHVAARHGRGSGRGLRVSHWRQGEHGDMPSRVFDTAEDGTRTDGPAVLILPPALNVEPISQQNAAPWIDWLRRQHADGVVLASVCAGAFVLGEAGLLEGRPATTHWAYAEQFRRRFPLARLDVDRLVIDDGDIVTAGGLMAWTDLGLQMIGRFFGPTVMVETARLLLLDPAGREQRFYSAFSPNLAHGDAAVVKAQHWIQVADTRAVSLAQLALKAGLEPRTLMRRFQKATGMTTTEYVQQVRVSKARESLQFGTASVDRVAWDVGYSDTSAFRKVFFRIVGLTPSQYRRRFRPE